MNHHDNIALSLLGGNALLAPLQQLVARIEPFLTPLLTLAQIAIAVLTFIWVFYRVKSARLLFREQERQANSK